MKKQEKGNRGYIAHRKKKLGIITAVCFAVVAAIFIAGLIIFRTRNNLFTVMAILLVLPSAKFAVGLIMFIPHKNVTDELYNALEKADNKFLHKYECIFTSKEKVTYVPAMVITDHSICAYTPDSKADAKKFEETFAAYVKEARLSINVILLKDEKQFIKKVKLMSGSREEGVSEENKERMQWIWESARCMCL